MRFTLKQKWLAFGDDYLVHDESGRHVYTIDGKAFTLLREKLALLDAQGKEVALIRERLVSLTPSYDIVRDGRLLAVVKKDLVNVFRVGFSVDVPGPHDLEAKGNLIDREYTFTRAGTMVATVSKRWFRFTDTYGVDIAEGEDTVLLLASAVVIDLVCHPDQIKAAATPDV
jgi:uncharacterized protein YxjI